MSPDSSPTGFFRFSIWRRENGAEWQGSSAKGGRFSIFKTEEYFYYHRASNDRSVLSQSLTILCSVAGLSHSRVGGGGGTSLQEANEDVPLDCGEERCVTILKTAARETTGWVATSGLTDGIAFSMESLEWGRTFSDFGGKRSSSHLRLANLPER